MKVQKKEIAKSQVVFKRLVTETEITCSYTTLYIEEENSISCFIPGFDLAFSAPNETESRKIGKAMTRSYLKFWLEQYGEKNLILELTKSGFKTLNHDSTLQKMFNHRDTGKIRFNLLRDNIPSEFATAQKFNEEANFAVAI